MGGNWLGFFGRKQQVQATTVSGALSAIGQAINMAYNNNPLKGKFSDKYLPVIQQILYGFYKSDLATK